MKKTGRKTLCTPQKTEELCEYLSHACTIRTACEACGVSEKSFREWFARGETSEQPFASFRAAVTRARGLGKAKLVKSIVDSGDWRAWLEMLARVYPSEYSKTEPREVIVQQVVAAGPSPEPEPPSKRERWIISGNGELPLTK